MSPADQTDGFDDVASTPGADRIRERRAPGPGLLSRLPGMAYQCRNDPRWTMEFVTGGCRDLTGYEPSEILGEDGPFYSQLIHPDDRDRVWREIQAAVADGRAFDIEYRIRTRERDLRWVWEQGHPIRDADGGILGLEGFIADITERRRATRELRRTMEMLRTLVEQRLFGVYVVQDGVFRFVNDTFARIFGYERQEVVGRMAPDEVVAEEDRERVAGNLRRRLEGDVRSVAYSFTGLRKDGTNVQVEVHGSRAELHGEPAVSGVLLDVTEREVLEQQLRTAQKREALAELTAAVAHDFNNFLTGIIGSVELAQERMEPEGEEGRHLELARTTAGRAAGLTRKLLTFSRQDVSRPETFDLSGAVERMATLLRQLLGSPITMEVETTAEPLPVRLDPGHMEQVIMNLALNARDAMPGGGVVAVRTGLDESGDGPSALLEVTDTGHGIDDETREKIFSAFFTTKDTGTGLGLATVQRILEDLDGQVEVESEVGRGTSFRVRIPLVEGEAGTREAAAEEVPPTAERGKPEGPTRAGERAAAGGARGGAADDGATGRETAGAGPTGSPDAGDGPIRILVVEDDEAVRQIMQAALLRHGYAVDAVCSTTAALEHLEGDGRAPALLLTDLSLPDRPGVELAREFRRLHPGKRVLLTSGYAPEEWAGGGLPDLSNGFLKKPFSIGELLEAVRTALDSPPPGTGLHASGGADAEG